MAEIAQETVEAFAAHAAAMLAGARRPLITGIARVSTEAQRLAVELADRTGAAIDWTDSPADAAGVIAFQTVGGVGATYGEIAERSDLLVYWRCDPAPLPGFDRIGDASRRRVIEVGRGELKLKAGADYEALSVLRAIAAEIDLDPAVVEQQTSVTLDAWRSLLDQIAGADYATIVRGSAVAEAGPAAVAAMTQLAQELHARTRVVIATPPSDDNAVGAENVLAWQTGYPTAVDFGRGYPRYLPGEATAHSIGERGEWDVRIILGLEMVEMGGPPIRTCTSVSVQRRDDAAAFGIDVSDFTQSGGTYYRTDGLALPVAGEVVQPTAEIALRALLDALPPEADGR